RWHAGQSVDVCTASHDGYRRLSSPIVHRRWIVGWKKSGWLVRDAALGTGRHHFDLRWRYGLNFSPISAVFAPGLDLEIPGEEQEMSAVYGEVVSARVLRLSCNREAPVEAGTAISLDGSASLHCLHRGPSVTVYKWSDAAGHRFLWFSDKPGSQKVLGWESDA